MYASSHVWTSGPLHSSVCDNIVHKCGAILQTCLRQLQYLLCLPYYKYNCRWHNNLLWAAYVDFVGHNCNERGQDKTHTHTHTPRYINACKLFHIQIFVLSILSCFCMSVCVCVCVMAPAKCVPHIIIIVCLICICLLAYAFGQPFLALIAKLLSIHICFICFYGSVVALLAIALFFWVR